MRRTRAKILFAVLAALLLAAGCKSGDDDDADELPAVEYKVLGGRLVWCSGGAEDMTVPGNASSIGNNAFNNCGHIKTLTIPATVTYIMSGTFSRVTIDTIYFGGTYDDWDAMVDGFGFTLDSTPVICADDRIWLWTAPDVPVNPDDWQVTDGVVTAYTGTETTVTLPDGVTKIEAGAIPAGTTIIFHGSREQWEELAANSDLTGLTAFAVDDDGTLVGYQGSGSDIVIPDGVTAIGGGVFEGCTDITTVTIPKGVTDIGDGAFSGCAGLTDVTIPGGVTAIGDGAFSGCAGLTDVTIPASVTDIGADAFKDCAALTDMTIPGGVTNIGDGAFSGCAGLTDVTIPASVTDIGDGAFKDCTGLAGVTIPASVEHIGDDAFDGCTSLVDITYGGTMEQLKELTKGSGIDLSVVEVVISSWVIRDGVLISYCGSDTDITIPDSVTAIGDGAFAGNEALTGVTIPEGVTSIGDGAFSGCTALTGIEIPEGVTTIGAGAFKDCTGLADMTIPDGVTTIGADAFAGCTNLDTITFAGTVAEWDALAEASGIADELGGVTVICSDGLWTPVHKHTWGEEYTDGRDGMHYQVCSECGKVSDPMEHRYDNVSYDADGHYKTCVDCGCTEKTASHTWSKYTDDHDGNHSKTCKIEGLEAHTEHEAHDYEYGDKADGSHYQTCKAECGYSKPVDHNWGAWRDDDDGYHSRTCEIEGFKAHTEREEHTYTDGTCAVCGAEEIPLTLVYVASTGSDDNPGSRSKPFATIQKAVDTVIERNDADDNASEYTIYVDGTLKCDENTYIGTYGMADFSALTKNLTLTIKPLFDTATLDGGARFDENGTVVTKGIEKGIVCANHAPNGSLNLTLENFVITGGYTTGNGTGGGVFVASGVTFTMKGGTISGNSAGLGGGVFVVSGGAFEISGGEINGNTAISGGGVCVYNNGAFTMTGGTISGNSAEKNGGGVYVNGGTLNMSDEAKIAESDDVYLYNGATITVAGDLAESLVATITPSAYTAGMQVLSGAATTLAANCGKFEVSEAGWKIDEEGKLALSPDIYVSEGGDDTSGKGSRSKPFATIQKAVDTVIARNDGATAYTIYVDGTLTQSAAASMANFSALDKNLTLTIKALSGTATLDANQKSRVINAAPASGKLNLTLESLTVTGGNVTGNGGGIYFGSVGGTLTISDGTTIKGNTASVNGGGVYVNAGTFTMTGGTISDCTATTHGGGVCIKSGGTFEMSGTAKITGCKMTSTAGGTGGGGIYNSGTLTITGGTISGNTASSYGGGICVYDNGTFTMEDGTISGGNAKLGGGVYVEGSTSNFTMKGGKISGNTATANGGGVYVKEGTFAMTGGTVSGNEANGSGTSFGGGGVYVYDNGTFTMTGDTTISGNTASASGGGVYVSGGSSSSGTFSMTGGTISGNTAVNAGGGVCVHDGTFTMEGGTIRENKADGSSELFGGGGIYLYRTTASMPGGRFTLKGGTVSGNEAEYGGGIWANASSECAMEGGSFSGNKATYGGGAYIYPGCTFKMSGSAQFADDNDMYLHTYTGATLPTVQIADDLTAESPVATITPSAYAAGMQVLSGAAATLAANCGKFEVSEAGWKIDEEGKLALSPDIYVSEGGDDTSGKGSQAKPFATLQKAFDLIQTLNLSTVSYIVHISGTVKGKSELPDDVSAQKISITGTTDAKLAGDASSSSYLIVSCSAPVEITNVTLTNNRASAIYVKSGANVTLGKGAAVFNNNFTVGGVDIASGGTFTMKSGATISENKNRTAGGGGGGGVRNKGTFIMEGGTISGNYVSLDKEHGGGVYSNGTFIMKGGEISGNYTSTSYSTGCGGGVYVAGGTFEMTGGTISGNRASSAGKGGGVYVSSGTFTMGGSASIPAGEDGKNDIYLASGKTITVASDLIAESPPVATITPSAYTAGKQVLSAASGTITQDICDKFAVTPQADGTKWKIAPSGSNGVLEKDTVSTGGGGISVTIPGQGTYTFKVVSGGTEIVDGSKLSFGASITLSEVRKDGVALTASDGTFSIEIRDQGENPFASATGFQCAVAVPTSLPPIGMEMQIYVKVVLTSGIVIDKKIAVTGP